MENFFLIELKPTNQQLLRDILALKINAFVVDFVGAEAVVSCELHKIRQFLQD
jgi:hypothetical protein